MTRVLIVGNGMVGSRLVQELLASDQDRRLQLAIVGDEPGDAYNRMQLSNVLAGKAKVTDLTLAGSRWYAEHGVACHALSAAVAVDRVQRTVRLVDGATLRYDRLVLATGSAAVIPPIEGLFGTAGELRSGVVAFRTLADCAEIDRQAQLARRAIVVGGGLLGLEAARGLAGRGVPVTVVQRGARLMGDQLDDGASTVLRRTLRAVGVEIRTDAVPYGVLGDDAVRGLALADGSVLDGDLLVLACGVRPRVELARSAGLAVGRGVVVDDQLRTSDPAVFAAGECVEHRGTTYGLVAPGWEQARVLAGVLTGRRAAYLGSKVVTRLKAAGIELAAMGRTGGPAAGSVATDDDDVRYINGARGIYQRLVVQDGRLVGAILLGDTRAAGTISQLFDRGGEVPSDPAVLLMARRNVVTAAVHSPMTLPGRATICHCNGVTKTAICDAWQNGARSVTDIADRTRATTGCGTCRDTVDGLLDWLAAADPDPVAAPRTHAGLELASAVLAG